VRVALLPSHVPEVGLRAKNLLDHVDRGLVRRFLVPSGDLLQQATVLLDDDPLLPLVRIAGGLVGIAADTDEIICITDPPSKVHAHSLTGAAAAGARPSSADDAPVDLPGRRIVVPGHLRLDDGNPL
jgi:hypothetical protein